MSDQKERFKIRTAVYLIPIKDGNVLLSRRYKTGWMDGNYSLISGHVDGKEKASDAMIRETYEESGIKVEKEDLIPVTVVHSNSSQEYIDIYFKTERWTGIPTIIEPDKCDDLSWFPINKLPENIVPNVKTVIESLNSNIPLLELGWEK